MSQCDVVSRRRALLASGGITICSLLTVGCGTPIATVESQAVAGIAVVAVVAAPEVSTPLSTVTVSNSLEEALMASGSRRVTPLAQVRAAVGRDRYLSLSKEFAQSGRLANQALQTVMATPLNARRGLLIRIEQNDTDILEPASEPFRDQSGQIASDRQRVVLASRRTVQVAATLIDLGTGSLRWRKNWSTSPIARTDYVRYTGSSFAGSVSVSLANSMINGFGGPAAPPPPDFTVALDAIFHELSVALPNH